MQPTKITIDGITHAVAVPKCNGLMITTCMGIYYKYDVEKDSKEVTCEKCKQFMGE